MKIATILEANGKQIPIKEAEAAVKADMKEKKIKGTDICVYMCTSEMAAYYTVDGVGDPDWKVML